MAKRLVKFLVVGSICIILGVAGFVIIKRLPLIFLKRSFPSGVAYSIYEFNPLRRLIFENLHIDGFIEIGKLQIDYSLFDFLRTRRFRHLLLEDVVLNLDSLPQGKGKGKKTAVFPRLGIDSAEIHDLTVIFKGKAARLAELQGSLRMGGSVLSLGILGKCFDYSSLSIDSFKINLEKIKKEIRGDSICVFGEKLRGRVQFVYRENKLEAEVTDLFVKNIAEVPCLKFTLNTADSSYRLSANDFNVKNRRIKRVLLLGRLGLPDTVHIEDFLLAVEKGYLEGSGCVDISVTPPLFRLNLEVSDLKLADAMFLSTNLSVYNLPDKTLMIKAKRGVLEYMGQAISGLELSATFRDGEFRVTHCVSTDPIFAFNMAGKFRSDRQEMNFRIKKLYLKKFLGKTLGFEDGVLKASGRICLIKGKPEWMQISGYAESLVRGQVSARFMSFDLTKNGKKGKYSVFAKDVGFTNTYFDSARLCVNTGRKNTFELSAKGKARDVYLAGDWQEVKKNIDVNFREGHLSLPDMSFSIEAPFNVVLNPDTIFLKGGEIALNDRGRITKLQGYFRKKTSEVSLALKISAFDLSTLKGFLPKVKKLRGIVDLDLTIRGGLEEPYIIGEITAKDARINYFEFDSLKVQGRYGDTALVISNLELFTDSVPSWGYAEIPAHLSLYPFSFKVDPSRDFKCGFYTERIDPTPILEYLGNFVVVENGYLSANISAHGRMEEPVFEGTFSLRAPEGTITSINSLVYGLKIDGHFENNRVVFDTIRGRSDEGKLAGSGYISLRGLKADSIDLKFNSTRIPFSLGANVNAIATGNLEIVGGFPEIWLLGDFYVDEAALYVPFGKGGGGGKSPSSIRYRFKIRADNNIYIFNEYTEMEFSANLEIKKEDDINTLVSGKLELLGGTFQYFDRTFNLTEGEIVFYNQKEINPELNLKGEVMVSDTITVNLTVTGTLKQPEIALTSTPPMPEEDIIAYLSFGRPFKEVPLSITDVQLLKERALGFAEGLISRELRRRLRVSELELSTGLGGEEPRFTVGFYLSKNLYFRYTHDILALDKDVFQARYRLTRNMSFYAERDKEGAFSTGLELTLRF